MSLLVPMMAYILAFFLTRHRLALESVALRQQLAVFKRKQPRPRLNPLDRLLWVELRRWYLGWADALILVKPETVVSWHRAGFRLFCVGSPGQRAGPRSARRFACSFGA